MVFGQVLPSHEHQQLCSEMFGNGFLIYILFDKIMFVHSTDFLSHFKVNFTRTGTF